MFSWFKKALPRYPEDCQWDIMEGKHGEKPMFVRRNTTAASFAGHPEYRHRVGVAIPLIAATELGLPTGEEMEQLNAIEDALNLALCVSQNSLQVLVVTTSGMREFIYYRRDPKTCPAALSKLEAAIGPHKLQAYIAEDATWSVYAQFSAGVA